MPPVESVAATDNPDQFIIETIDLAGSKESLRASNVVVASEMYWKARLTQGRRSSDCRFFCDTVHWRNSEMSALLIATAFFAAEPANHPLTKDRTGLNWVLPFDKAQQQAGKSKRLLMIKPVAFGTKPNGCW